MNKLIIHPGYPKTGTTAIQESLFNNRELLNRQGLLYPYAGQAGNGEIGHHNLGWKYDFHPSNNLYDRSKGGVSEVINEAFLKKSEQVILSSESIFYILRERPEVFFEEIRSNVPLNVNVEFLFVVRRADKFFESAQLQMLKQWEMGRTKRRLEDMNSFVLSKVGNVFGHLSPIYEAKEILGKNFVKILPYTSSVVTDFYDLLGIQGLVHGGRKKGKTNKSLTLKKAVVLNKLASSPDWKKYQEIIIGNKESWNALSAFSSDERSYTIVPYEVRKKVIAEAWPIYMDIFQEPPRSWAEIDSPYFDEVNSLDSKDKDVVNGFFGFDVFK